MPDLQPIKERLRCGPTIDDASAVNRSYQEDIQAMVPEVERLRIAVDMYRRITGDNEAEIKRLRGAIEAHRTQCHKTCKVAQAWWDEDLDHLPTDAEIQEML